MFILFAILHGIFIVQKLQICNIKCNNLGLKMAVENIERNGVQRLQRSDSTLTVNDPSVDPDGDNYRRDFWRNKAEFLLSSVGLTVGIGK